MDLTESTARELINAMSRLSGALERQQALLAFPEGSEARSKALAGGGVSIGITHPGDKFFSGGGSYGPLGQTAGEAVPVGQGGGMAGGSFVPPWSDYAIRMAEAEAKKARALDEARIREAIDTGGGQECDIEGVIRELDKAGFVIVEK